MNKITSISENMDEEQNYQNLVLIDHKIHIRGSADLLQVLHSMVKFKNGSFFTSKNKLVEKGITKLFFGLN